MKKILRFEDFVKEEADYRNVTGNGTMGNPDPQNSGPSFNKGPDAAIYGRPDVIGVERDTIEDPYFGQSQEQKKKRARKHPYIEKKRKEKSKYLVDIDKETLSKRVDENLLELSEDPIKKLRAVSKPILVNELVKDLSIEESVVKLNELFKNKWIGLIDEIANEIYLYCKVMKFGRIDKYLCVFYRKTFNDEDDERFYESNVVNTFTFLKLDYIFELEEYVVKQTFSELDPMGEEDWDDDNNIIL
jgi:ribosomal protein S25